jgi:uncharacterized protein YecT (DUF1311 family)
MKSLALALFACLVATGISAKDVPLYKTEDCNKYTSQMDMNQCANGNSDSADAALNVTYKQVMQWLPNPKAKADLKMSERAWIKSRDKQCNDEAGDEQDGGSIWQMEMSNCLEKQTAARIRVLNKMRTCTAGVSVCNPH